MKDTYFANTKAILGLRQTAEALYPAPAGLRGLMTQMPLDSISDLGAHLCLESP
jgi:hypothetical protein